jgi:hypothetical protein
MQRMGVVDTAERLTRCSTGLTRSSSYQGIKRLWHKPEGLRVRIYDSCKMYL